jgi:exosortase
VSHAGAVITAGSYELLVADACAGLNSLIALTAVGAVYLYVARRRSLRANAAVILALAPIAIAANLVRVMILVLITHHLGYDAGQSFLHETAGLLMFAAALAGVFLVDALAARAFEKRHARG